MSDLVVVAFDEMNRAEEVRNLLIRLQEEHLIDLEDAVVCVKDQNGRVHLQQTNDLAAAGIAQGGFWGLLIGSLFLSPVLGATVGAAAGAISGALSDIGIPDEFMKELSGKLQNGTSALFILIRQARPQRVLEQLAGYPGHVIHTSLSPENEDVLRRAIEQVDDPATPMD